jgi:hypothetical protein
MFAQCIAPLADTASKYLELGQALKAHGTFKLSDIQDTDETIFEVSRAVTSPLRVMFTATADVLRS